MRFIVPLRRLRSPSPLLQWDPFGPGVLAVANPMAVVDLAREVVCSPVPVGTCLQQHWREWMEVGAGEWVVKTALWVCPPLSPPLLLAGPIEFVSYAEGSDHLIPSQRKQYLGMVLDSVRALVFPSPERISRFLSVAQNFLEDRTPTVSLWRSLLGHLASLERLVPGGRQHNNTTIGHYKEKMKIGLKMARSDYGLAHGCLGACDTGRGQALTG
ncbi:hypothetical protein E2C01_039418 [Portunus trituberculatus]|uniref:Uncharacterized protein n=1 Tax=Portunus trituberculatus TaxID=210409 RepID=A0A5B7FGT3_PORTR|nr:hypothetical protein [Portunus trituberculatus]